jgi:hypothetical protein
MLIYKYHIFKYNLLYYEKEEERKNKRLNNYVSFNFLLVYIFIKKTTRFNLFNLQILVFIIKIISISTIRS